MPPDVIADLYFVAGATIGFLFGALAFNVWLRKRFWITPKR